VRGQADKIRWFLGIFAGVVRRSHRSPGQRTFLPASLLLCFFFLVTASAQISPGPLSRPHQSLSGSTNCAACHKFGGQATLKCIDCHTEIATRLLARKGLHATYNLPAAPANRASSASKAKSFPRSCIASSKPITTSTKEF